MSMGIFSRSEAPKKSNSLLAQYAPTIMGENLNSLFNYVMPRVQRNEAMSVPSIARCRNLLSSVVADLPLNLYRNSTGEELDNPIWVNQPAINQPRSVTMAWTVDSLLMYGVAYWQVTEISAEDSRPSRFQWIPNVKVTFNTDLYGMTITEYFIDAVAVPMSGLGSIVTFQAFDEGILERGSETIRAAIDLRKAAVIAASTPMPSGVIKNNGADLDPKMRVFAPVIVRGEEEKGVRLWEFGKEIYMQLLGIAEDEDYGDFTDISEGRDFTVDVVTGDIGGQIFLCPWMKTQHIGTYAFTGDMPKVAQYTGKL